MTLDKFFMKFGSNGSKTLDLLVSVAYFNQLVDQVLIPIFLQEIKGEIDFKKFATLTMKMKPSELITILSELKVLPKNTYINKRFKSWRGDINTKSILKQAEVEVKEGLKQLMIDNVEN